LDIKLDREIEHEEVVYDASTKEYIFRNTDESWNVKTIKRDSLLSLLGTIQYWGWELVGEIHGCIIVKRIRNEVE
jgi:hypothetical protein